MRHKRKSVPVAVGCLFVISVCLTVIHSVGFNAENASAQNLRTAVGISIIASEDLTDDKQLFQRIQQRLETFISATPHLRFRVHSGEIPKWKIYLIFADTGGDSYALSITLTSPSAVGEILVMNHLMSVLSLPEDALPKAIQAHIDEVNISLKLVLNVIESKESQKTVGIIEDRFSTTLIREWRR